MGRASQPGILRQVAERRPGSLHDPMEALQTAGKALLTSRGLTSVASAPLVEDRKQGEANTGFLCRGRNPLRHLGFAAVGSASWSVMQIVELRDSGESRLQHLHLRQTGDGLDIVRRKDLDHAVHLPPPGPEVVPSRRTAPLGASGHCTLKGVTVKIDRRRQQDAHSLSRRLRVRGNGLDPAVIVDDHRDPPFPASAGKRNLRPEFPLHPVLLQREAGTLVRSLASLPLLDESICAYIMAIPRPVHRPHRAMNATVLANTDIATMQENGDPYGIIPDGAIAIGADGTISWCGRRTDLPGSLRKASHRDLGGRLVTPALIDCHTHLIWGGNRAKEFEMRLKGRTYEEIAQAGGGILSTVNATRAARDETLFDSALERANGLVAEGVSTIEIKSGYGLDVETELRMLRIARRVADKLPVRIRTTFLGAHAVPPEYAGRADAYIDEVCIPALESAHREALVDAVDGFCEKIAFSPSQIQRVFAHSENLGLPVKLHAEQLSNLGGANLAARFGALSADHLEFLDSNGVSAMAAAGTVAVLLPGAFYTLRETRKPPVGLLREAEVSIAVATDCNPGSSPLESLLLAMNMACILFELHPEEALAGATRNAARALGIADAGQLSPGLRADLAIWNAGHPAEIAYRTGANPLHERWFAGRPQ